MGAVVFLAATALHPSQADPSDLPAALAEYAGSAHWVESHIGQFLGLLLIVFGLVALERSFTEEPGAALARLAMAGALVAAGAFAALHAVDGIAVKFVAEAWVQAPAAEKPAAFRVAEAVRQIEIGLAAFSSLVFGIAIFGYGTRLS